MTEPNFMPADVDRSYPYAERPTERQLEVLQLIANGLRNAQIVHQMDITNETIKGYMRNSFYKLDAENRTHAVAIAMRKGWIK